VDIVTLPFRKPSVGILLAAVAATAIVVGLRAVPAPAPPPHTVPGWTFVPLTGEVLDNAVDDADGEYDGERWNPPDEAVAGGCVPFLQALIAHDHWQLQIDERRSGCLGTEQLRTYVIDASGEVVVHQPGLRDRALALTPAELARLRTIDQGACVRAEPVGYGERFYELSIGPSEGQGGAHVASDTEIGEALGAILDAAQARYADELAATHPIQVELAARSLEHSDTWTPRTATYHLAVDTGGMLVVHRGHRELYRQQLEAQDLADLADAVLGHLGSADDQADASYALGRGTLLFEKHRHELTLDYYERSPGLAILAAAIYEANAAWYGE